MMDCRFPALFAAWLLVLCPVFPAGAGEAQEKPSAAVADSTAEKAAVGTAAPNFTLNTVDGQDTFTLATHKGKIVVVQFWNHECPWIQGSYAKTQELADKYKDKGVVFVAIDCTFHHKAEDVRNFATVNKFTVPLLMNTNGDVGQAYAATRTPETFVIDREGIVRYRGALDNRSTPAHHGDVNYVEMAIKSLLDGKPVDPTEKKAFGCTIKYKSS